MTETATWALAAIAVGGLVWGLVHLGQWARARRSRTPSAGRAGTLLHDPAAQLVASTAITRLPRGRVRGSLALRHGRLVFRSRRRLHEIDVPLDEMESADVTRHVLDVPTEQAILRVTWTGNGSQEHVAGWVVNDPASWVATLSRISG